MINLLSQEIKQERTAGRLFRQLLFFFIILITLTLSTWLAVIYVENSLQIKNKSLDSEISSVGSDLLKFRDLEKDINLTNGRLTQVDNIVSSRAKWSEIVAKLANNTPSTIQINNLQFALDGAVAADTKSTAVVYQVTIAGTAKTLEDIELYRKTLDNSKVFSNSLFKSASLNKDKNNFSFGLTTTVKSGGK